MMIYKTGTGHSGEHGFEENTKHDTGSVSMQYGYHDKLYTIHNFPTYCRTAIALICKH